MSGLRVRAMVEGDLGPVGVLAGELVRQHHAFDARRFFLERDVEEGYRWWFRKQLGQTGVLLQVAELDGAVVGYVYGTLEGRDWARLLDAHGAIHDLFVDARVRRQGVARALMESAMATLRSMGAAQIVLSSATPNVEAQALFSRLGFRSTMIELTWSPP